MFGRFDGSSKVPYVFCRFLRASRGASSACSGAELLSVTVRAPEVALEPDVAAASLDIPEDVLDALERRATWS